MTKLTKIILALVLILGIPAMSMATCFNCYNPCGADGYSGCTVAEITQIGGFNQGSIEQNGGSWSSNLAIIEQEGIGNKGSIVQAPFADHNKAIIDQNGWNNQAAINQNMGADYNEAYVTQDGLSNKANIEQYSAHNLASIGQNGIGNNASISQGIASGSHYTANVSQTGFANSATILQK